MSIQEKIDIVIKPRRRPKVEFGESLTKQAFKDQVNVNRIIAKYQKGQMVTHLNSKEPFYGDVSEIASYQKSLDIVMQAQELFMGMSSQVREKFQNDPAKMIAFLKDKKNHEEAVKLGLIKKKEVVTPPVTPPPPPQP